MTIIVVASILCIFYICDYYLEQKKADKVNDQLSAAVEFDITRESGDEKKEKKIDISKMMEKYPNACGYLYCEDFLSYPVLQTEDNDFYLEHDAFGNYNKYGSIYFDFRCTTSSKKYIIYGHNMKNGSMFGNLDKLKDEKFLNDHKDFILAIRNKTYDCEILYTAFTTAGSNWYELEYQKNDDIADFAKNMEINAYNKTGAFPDENDGLLLLSTCTSGNGRYVVLLSIKNLETDNFSKALYEN